MFIYRHRVQFYETDLMGIVHHSNYLRFYEEARVSWAHSKNLLDYQKPESAFHFAVYGTQVRHLKPAIFGDELEIEVQAKQQGARILFQYRMRARGETLSVAITEHVSLNKELKLMRLPKNYTDILEKETWTETWL